MKVSEQCSYFWLGKLTLPDLAAGSHFPSRRASVQVLAGCARECAVAGAHLGVSS